MRRGRGRQEIHALDYSKMEYRARPNYLPVECAALGFLIESPMHGYELRTRIRSELGSLWRVATSRLYDVLHRMADGGWIEPTVETQDGRPSRTVYCVTPSGERVFWDWVESPVRLRNVRVEFLAKVYFLRRLAPERLPFLFSAQRSALMRRLDRISRRPATASADRSFEDLVDSYRRGLLDHAIGWLDAYGGAKDGWKEEE